MPKIIDDIEEKIYKAALELFMENGYTKKKAIKVVANLRDLPKSEVYEKAIVIDARDYL